VLLSKQMVVIADGESRQQSTEDADDDQETEESAVQNRIKKRRSSSEITISIPEIVMPTPLPLPGSICYEINHPT